MKQESYRQPRVEVGDVVLWFDSQEETGACAAGLVTLVGNDHAGGSVTLTFWERGWRPVVKSGVRHRTHPDRDYVRRVGQGVWEHTPRTLRALDLEASVRELLDALAPAPPAPGKGEGS